jgi:hypothetical protein
MSLPSCRGVSLFYHILERQLLRLCAVSEDYLIVQSRRPPTLSPPGRPGHLVSCIAPVPVRRGDVVREGWSEAFFLLDVEVER